MTDSRRGTARLPIASGAQSLRATWRLLRRRPARLAFVVLLQLAGAAAGLVAPWALGGLVDLAMGGGAASTVWLLGSAILVSALLSAVATGLGAVLMATVFETALAELREEFIERAFDLPQLSVERAGTGDLVSRASDDVSEVSDAIPVIVPSLTAAGFAIAVTLAGISALDWRLAAALLAVVPVHVLTVRWYLRTAPPIYSAERSAAATRAHRTLTSLRCLETVLAYRLSDTHGSRIASANWDVVRWSLRARTVQNMFAGRLNLAEYLGLACVLLVAFFLVGDGSLTVGGATTATLLLIRLFDPVGRLLALLDDAQSAAASLARIVGVAMPADRSAQGEGHDEAMRESPAPPLAPPGTVAALDNVHYRYAPESSSGFALREVSLRVDRGERVALVGASGAGKSTIAALIAGIHEPDRGTVSRPPRTLLLAQESHVFAGTLADHLRFAKPEAGDDELLSALHLVGAGTLLASLPGGLSTRIGRGGHALGAAQQQQLALASVVLADPQLAILDEATADADSADAQLLDRAARAATANRSALVIAHRLSQAAACDRILVVSDGSIVESGTHEELLEQGDRYASLWAAQAGVTPSSQPRDASTP